MMFTDVAKWRARIDTAGDGLVSATAALGANRSTEIVGESLNRTPAP